MKVLVNQKGKAAEAGRGGYYVDPVIDLTDEELVEKFDLSTIVAGFIMQRLVTGRAAYDRFRRGNDTNAAKSDAEARKAMESYKYAKYTRPTEGLEPEAKLANDVRALTGEALRKSLRSMGIPEDSIDVMAAAIEAKAKAKV